MDIVRAAIQEDADAIALSSYQGGHNEYFRFMIDQLKERGAGHIQVFGGGGGTITLTEIAELEAYGVNRIYHPDDGMGMGLVEMIEDVVTRTQEMRQVAYIPMQIKRDDSTSIAAMLTALAAGLLSESELKLKRREWLGAKQVAPVIGITGTGGAGKSSVTDEILNRFLTINSYGHLLFGHPLGNMEGEMQFTFVPRISIFSIFLTGYMSVRMSATDAWPNSSDVFAMSFGGAPLTLLLIAIMTFVLITSSGTMALAVNFAYRGDKRKAATLIALTALLGASFVGMQVFEWSKLIFHEGVRPWTNPMGAAQFGSVFFMITGYHGMHVTAGVI